MIRHIEWNRTDAAILKLQDFVEQVHGNQYQLSLSKILVSRTSGMIDEEVKVVQPQQKINMQANGPAIEESTERKQPARLVSANRKFQCSELVMKAFKACGIIKEHARSSTNYTPGHLTQAR